MYTIFTRSPWTREGDHFIPNGAARRTVIGHAETIEEAREKCAEGPANIARAAGKEYRHLTFNEFTSDF